MKKLSLVLISLLLAVCSQARTITVDDDAPADFDTIQAAIDDSNNGDVIVVSIGTYTGDGNRFIDFDRKAITVCSVGPNDPNIVAATVIDCNNLTYGFNFRYGTTEPSIINGITITKASGGQGAAILGGDEGLTIMNCIVTGNNSYDGGAIAFCNGPITNCIITGNASFKYGGSLYHCQGPISKCIISNNTSRQLGSGGPQNCDGPITGCTISENSGYYGGGLYACRGPISNCIITGNVAERGGGGISVCDGPINNCVISGNSGLYAGGIYGTNNSIYNSVITHNSGSTAGGVSVCHGSIINCTIAYNRAKIGALDYCKELITNCIIWANDSMYSAVSESSLPIYSCADVEDTGYGCFNLDPCFVAIGYWDTNGTPGDDDDDFWVEGDYHLWVDSPCIDAGDPNYMAGPNETDLDGRPRIIGGTIDMGAYEYNPPIPAEVNFRPGVINLASGGRFVFCGIRLPEGYDVNEIEPNSILLEDDIEPVSVELNEEEQVAVTRFSRSEIQGILDTGWVELLVSGELTDGTLFEGIDTIRVIDKGEK